MPNFQRIQDCIDQIAPLIREAEGLQPMSATMIGGLPVEPSYSAEALRNLDDKIKTWKAVTTEILTQEVGEANPQLFDFCARWRAPLRDYDFKTRLKRKLQNARSDLRILLAVAKEKEGAQPQYDEIWALVHPSIIAIAHDRMEDGYYADAVEDACKEVNARVREIVLVKTGEELDGAKLMLKAFSVDNPIIKIAPGISVSAQDTQKGYMQIFAGVMTGIRNPKAHDNENITREDALRKLILLSILMYKIDDSIHP